MRSLAAVLFLTWFAACAVQERQPAALTPPPPQPRACFASCSSNIECSGVGAPRSCPFCNFGTCRSTRPELVDCQRACEGVEPRPVWCDLGGCGEVLRGANVRR